MKSAFREEGILFLVSLNGKTGGGRDFEIERGIGKHMDLHLSINRPAAFLFVCHLMMALFISAFILPYVLRSFQSRHY